MKKYFNVIMLVMAIVMLTGCGKEEQAELVKTCTLSSEVSEYTMNNEYKVYGNDKTVDKVITVETIESDDAATLAYFETFAKTTYDTMNRLYGGYSYIIDADDNKIVISTTINYKKMNLKKFASDNPNVDYVKNNKILLDGIVSLYEGMGATCK